MTSSQKKKPRISKELLEMVSMIILSLEGKKLSRTNDLESTKNSAVLKQKIKGAKMNADS
jgi:hypothetical protein